jgi:hypothetical protein
MHCSCQLFVQILSWSTFFEKGGLVVIFLFRTHFLATKKINKLQRIGEEKRYLGRIERKQE